MIESVKKAEEKVGVQISLPKPGGRRRKRKKPPTKSRQKPRKKLKSTATMQKMLFSSVVSVSSDMEGLQAITRRVVTDEKTRRRSVKIPIKSPVDIAEPSKPPKPLPRPEQPENPLSPKRKR